MTDANAPFDDHRSAVSRAAHVVERIGLAMAGASCGLFVAANLIRANVEMGSGLIAFLMMIVGGIGYYLGIDLPPTPDEPTRRIKANFNVVELFSAIGTFLTALASVISVYVIVADERLRPATAAMIAGGWALGALMQIAAGLLARARRNRLSR